MQKPYILPIVLTSDTKIVPGKGRLPLILVL